MTREDAIKIIRKMLACTDLTVRANLNADMVSACNLAIKALEQEPVLNKIKKEEENTLKFYYVESEDDYWIGQRKSTLYYAHWNKGLSAFVWSASRYLPWGEHFTAPWTLWKEYTFPSEPKEIPFIEWLNGFLAKYFNNKEQEPQESEDKE